MSDTPVFFFHFSVMLEAGGERVPQPYFLKAIKSGVKHCQQIVRDLQQLESTAGNPKRPLAESLKVEDSVKEAISK